MFPFVYRYKSSWFWNKLGGEDYRIKAAYSEQHVIARKLLKQALAQIKFTKLLEVGCGTGNNLVFFKSIYPDASLVGCDFSKEQIQTASQNSGIQFDVADARKLPYKNEEFDVVVTVGCLAHIPTQYINQCAGELQRVAKKYLFIFEEDRDFMHHSLYQITSRSGWHFYHDYVNLFKQCDLGYRNNDVVSMKTGLHTHIYYKKNNTVIEDSIGSIN